MAEWNFLYNYLYCKTKRPFWVCRQRNNNNKKTKCFSDARLLFWKTCV